MSDEFTQLIAVPTCQALINRGPRKGQVCGNPTISVDYPFCYQHLHDISSTAKRSKRYDDSLPDTLRDKFEEHMNDSNPQDLLPEIANLRTMINHIMEEGTVIDEKTGRVMILRKELDYIFAATKLIGDLAEKQAKINPDNMIPANEVMRLIADIVGIIRRNIPVEMITVREKMTNEIQKYCRSEITNKKENENAEQ